LEQALTGMAADLKGLRLAMELMAEQVSKLVALGDQQMDAISRLTPLMVQSAEGISSSLRELVSAVGSIPSSRPLPHPAEPLTAAEQPALQPGLTHKPAASSEPEPHMEGAAGKHLKQGQRSQRREEQARKMASAPIVVKSIPDAKRPDRFYTTIRLPREVWDGAGFGPDDRLVLDWSGKTLRIERVAKGGVKPKSIGAAAVILQTWKLENLNFDQPNVTTNEGTLRLTLRA
jgi:hypothetical protein